MQISSSYFQQQLSHVFYHAFEFFGVIEWTIFTRLRREFQYKSMNDHCNDISCSTFDILLNSSVRNTINCDAWQKMWLFLKIKNKSFLFNAIVISASKCYYCFNGIYNETQLKCQKHEFSHIYSTC